MPMSQLKISQQITKRDSVALDMYLKDIGNIPLISSQEEEELAKRIAKGDKKALNKLIASHLSFVVSVAKQYPTNGLQLEDIINAGNWGLKKAASRFDVKLGFRFISYAVWWIRQSILYSCCEISKIIRVPLNRSNQGSKILKTISKLERKYERTPSIEEVAEELDMPPNEVRAILEVSSKHMSLNSPFVKGEENTLLDVLEDETEAQPDHGLVRESLSTEINSLIQNLSPRYRTVICEYYGIGRVFPMTLEEIGKELGLTRERVRQIKEKALESLRSKAGRLKLYTADNPHSYKGS